MDAKNPAEAVQGAQCISDLQRPLRSIHLVQRNDALRAQLRFNNRVLPVLLHVAVSAPSCTATRLHAPLLVCYCVC